MSIGGGSGVQRRPLVAESQASEVRRPLVAESQANEVMGARKASKCEAPSNSDERTMRRTGGGQGLRVCGAAHTKHVWSGWGR